VDLLVIALVGRIAVAEAPASPAERSCTEFGGRLQAAPVPLSSDVRPPSVIRLEYPDLGGTTPAHYAWPMQMDVLVDAKGQVRRVCTRQPAALGPFGEALSKSLFRPAGLRGQEVAYEFTMTIRLPELEKARKQEAR
jgi:hypothetical protein